MATTNEFPQAAIRRYQEADWPAVWLILRTTIGAGDTFAFAPNTSEVEMQRVWIEAPLATFVACASDGGILGTYYIKANQPGLGSHVCNCGYAVAPESRGRGVASAMCVHSQATAVSMGFRAMQFNLVVSTNERAVALWKRHGFAIVGTLPGVFQHQRIGFVDAFVMHKALTA